MLTEKEIFSFVNNFLTLYGVSYSDLNSKVLSTEIGMDGCVRAMLKLTGVFSYDKKILRGLAQDKIFEKQQDEYNLRFSFTNLKTLLMIGL